MWGQGSTDDYEKLGQEVGEKHLDKGLVELKNESSPGKKGQTHERKEISGFKVGQTF